MPTFCCIGPVAACSGFLGVQGYSWDQEYTVPFMLEAMVIQRFCINAHFADCYVFFVT
jgi:hypothetical protein